MEHRAWTVIFHRLRSFTWTLAASQVRLTTCISLSRLLLHVCFGRPRFLLPCGFHSSACLVMLEGSFRRVWPIHRHFLRLTWTAIGSWFALDHRSVFGTLSYHLRRRTRRRHLLMKVWIFLEMLLVTFQVSAPYSNTALTLELKTLNFVMVEMAVSFHTGRRMPKACWAFLILAVTSSFVPPVLLILLLRYTNSSTSSTTEPSIVTGSSCMLLARRSFVFCWLIVRPTGCAVSLRALTLSCMSWRRCDKRARSSANSRSSNSNFLRRVHWMRSSH